MASQRNITLATAPKSAAKGAGKMGGKEEGKMGGKVEGKGEGEVPPRGKGTGQFLLRFFVFWF